MTTTHVQTDHETTVSAPGIGEIRILHPPGTFALTPASLISLQAIAQNRNLLEGIGLDWGSGTGCLTIAAAKCASVQKVIALEVSEANVAIARENAGLNDVQHKTKFLLSDSYSPTADVDRQTLDSLNGRVNFVVTNPPASDGDDGFGYRRVVLKGALKYLAPGGVVFLSVSSQYGNSRVEGLCEEVPGFSYSGVIASTDWVPFDLALPDLLEDLWLYAREEDRGGLSYTFRNVYAQSEGSMDARSALGRFKENGQSPLMNGRRTYSSGIERHPPANDRAPWKRSGLKPRPYSRRGLR